MDRREFIENTGILGTAALLAMSGCSMFEKHKYKKGLQLYTIHKDMLKSPIDSLKAAKSMGYEDFETFGFDGDKDTYYGYKSSEFKQILDDLQLTASSGHYGFSSFLNKSADDLARFVDQCILGAQTTDMKYIVWPWLSPEQRTIDHFKLMASKLNTIGQQVTAAGLGFAYHNHGFDFIDHQGENGFDIILNETDPELVKLEMDMYWVMHSSKLTPKELVKQQPGRFVLWHIKDMDKVSRDYTELGNGSIDYTEILPTPDKAGLEYYYLEQGGNFAHTPMKSIAETADFFKKNLRKYL